MTITLYELAQRFVGLREITGTTDNPQIMAMLRLDDVWPQHDEVAWCSAFVNYCAWLLRLPRSKRLNARSWLDVGVPVALSDASAAYDVVVFWRRDESGPWGHVGLYAWHDAEHVYVLGGNQGNAVSVAPYPRGRLLGVRRLHV